MPEITKNGKIFLRFKIGDEFTAISGKGSFNKMKLKGLAQKEFDEEEGFIYPFYDGSTKNNHIKGYSIRFNYNGKALKVAKDGAEAGKTKFVIGKTFNGDHSYFLISNNFINYYFEIYFSKN